MATVGVYTQSSCNKQLFFNQN